MLRKAVLLYKRSTAFLWSDIQDSAVDTIMRHIEW